MISWSAEVNHFCIVILISSTFFSRVPLIRKEAVAFLCLLLDQSHNLAPTVFKACFVNLDALFKSTTFLPCPLPSVPLPELHASQFRQLEGFERMLFWPCANRDTYCCCRLDFLVVVVVIVNVSFYWRRVHHPSFRFFLTLLTLHPLQLIPVFLIFF